MAKSRSRAKSTRRSSGMGGRADGPPRSSPDWFGRLATETARMAGQPVTFLVVIAVILGWGLSGAYFGYSETWLLFINTAGTIVTALMVFLIQNTQNRDTLALQLKLAELILVMEGAENRMALAEDLSHEDLEGLKKDLRDRTRKAGRSET